MEIINLMIISKFCFLKVCFIDFQLVRYGSPALDIVNLLYCCTSHELRADKMDQLLDEYLSSVSNGLTNLGCSNGDMQYCQANKLKEM